MRAEEINKLIPNYKKAQREIKKIAKTGYIERVYFDLAYGVTPALFLTVIREDDEFLERVRLIPKENKYMTTLAKNYNTTTDGCKHFIVDAALPELGVIENCLHCGKVLMAANVITGLASTVDKSIKENERLERINDELKIENGRLVELLNGK